MMGTIINLAQNYVGSNNINLFAAHGQLVRGLLEARTLPAPGIFHPDVASWPG